MDGDSWLSWTFLILLLFAAAYFAVAEVAMASVSRIRLKARLELGDMRAKNALYIQDNFDSAISAILIGTNIVHISAATLTTVLVTRLWKASSQTDGSLASWVAVGTICCTVAVFFAGEMLPKSLGKRYSEACALGTAGSLKLLMTLLRPLIRALSAVAAWFARLFPSEPEITVTEEELYDIIESMTDEGGLDSRQGELVHSALEFGDVTVEHVFTPRVDMAALDIKTPDEEVLTFLKGTHFSRIPVFEGSTDNIIGVLQVRRYIREYLLSGKCPALRELLDEPCFVHRSAPVEELLQELSRRKLGMAVVTDSYGGTMGIITVEDILEELVGDIWDEDDVASVECRATGENTWELRPDMDMEDLLETLDLPDPEDTDWDRKTVGEWVYEQSDILPRQGESFRWHRLEFTVAGMDHHRIRRLTVKLLPAEEGGEAQ